MDVVIATQRAGQGRGAGAHGLLKITESWKICREARPMVSRRMQSPGTVPRMARKVECARTSAAFFPATSRKASARKLSEQMKK